MYNSLDKLGTVVKNKKRTKASKQTKEVATLERTKSTASAHSTKKSEENKKAVQFSDKNKVYALEMVVIYI